MCALRVCCVSGDTISFLPLTSAVPVKHGDAVALSKTCAYLLLFIDVLACDGTAPRVHATRLCVCVVGL